MTARFTDNGAQPVLWKHPGVLAGVIGAAVVVIIALAAALGVERSKHPPPCPPTSPGCPENWIRIQGKFYYFSKAEGNWTDSQKNCSSHAASLAAIESLQQLVSRTDALCKAWRSPAPQAGLESGWAQPLKGRGELGGPELVRFWQSNLGWSWGSRLPDSERAQSPSLRLPLCRAEPAAGPAVRPDEEMGFRDWCLGPLQLGALAAACNARVLGHPHPRLLHSRGTCLGAGLEGAHWAGARSRYFLAPQ
nr:uncharacterized protein LOC112547226 [Pelodiscus sinensis]|eukprot:XP_025044789.1 uncharacterized protein LOC112547226 [Pelodiscus sinensis]